MDKIRSLTSGVDVRADHGHGLLSGRHSDADIIVSKAAPLLALDTLLTHSDADLTGAMPVGARPPTAVVVDLSPPALAPTVDAARQLVRALAPDYNHLDPHKPHPELIPGDSEPGLPPALESRAVSLRELPYPGSTSPGVRPDLHPHGVQLPVAVRLRSVQKAGVSMAAEAHDNEPLARLELAAERYAGTPVKLSGLSVAAAILGALIVISLM
jgi:hypothetical protein